MNACNQNRNHNYHINYFVKNHKLQYKIFHLILQSMIHFVSLFISKTYQNMIVNLLLAFFRQIFEMTYMYLQRDLSFFPQILRWHARIFTERYIRYSGHQKLGITGDKGRDKMGIDLSGPLWRYR